MSERNNSCRYCGRENVHGPGCMFSPDGMHSEIGDADHCIYCGSTNYGTGCMFSPEKGKVHKHGHGKAEDGKMHCVWCGMVLEKSGGTGCMFSPNGKHQL